MIRQIVVLLLLAMAGICKEEKTTNRFPHKLWIYWHDKDISSAPIFVQLCINNIRHFAGLSKWEVYLVDNHNIVQYISEQSIQKLAYLKQRIPLLYQSGLTPQALSDLFRALLLHDNGGMWVDISSIFLHDLSWVQNLEQFELIQNSIAEQPEILMYTSNMIFGGNKTVIFDEKKQRDLYLFPGLQFWSVITKPHSKLMTEMIEELIFLYSQESFKGYIQEKKSQGFLYYAEQIPYFSFSTIHFQTVMQRKQKEIDSNPSKFNVKYAVEYYGIWTINSVDSAYSIFYIYGWKLPPIIRHLVYYPFSSFPEKVKKAPFLKFNSGARGEVQQFLDKAQKMDCSVEDGAFSNNSFISQYLFQYSEDLPVVRKIRSLEARPNGWSKSQCINSQLKNGMAYFSSIAGTFILLVVCLIGFCCVCLRWFEKTVEKRCTSHAEQAVNVIE